MKVQHILGAAPLYTNTFLLVTDQKHGILIDAAAEPDTVETARAAIAESHPFDEVYETHAGCTVTCHCGPHTLGVLFIRK